MFKPDGSDQAVAFIYPNEDENGPFVDRYVADVASGRIYPSRYLPSDPKQWLTGRRATLRTYADDKIVILWLEPQRGAKGNK